MNKQTAVLIGASGLTGGYVLQLLLQDDTFDTITIFVRSQLPIIHPKLKQHVINFENPGELSGNLTKHDVLFCCIGTTLKKVGGNKTLYEKIDFDIPVNAARLSAALGFNKFLLISSVGANDRSSNFYLRLKGRTEKAVQHYQFKSLWIFRPSTLLGIRTEKRNGEKILQAVTKVISSLLFGTLKKYHGIEAEALAAAMVNASKEENDGIHVLEYNDIIKYVTIMR